MQDTSGLWGYGVLRSKDKKNKNSPRDSGVLGWKSKNKSKQNNFGTLGFWGCQDDTTSRLQGSQVPKLLTTKHEEIRISRLWSLEASTTEKRQGMTSGLRGSEVKIGKQMPTLGLRGTTSKNKQRTPWDSGAGVLRLSRQKLKKMKLHKAKRETHISRQGN